MSYNSICFHYVFATRRRSETITPEYERELYAYIFGTCKNLASNPTKKQYRNLKLLRINGISNHIHLLISAHTSFDMEDFPRDIKRSSSYWLNTQKEKFPKWEGWSKKYGVFTVSAHEKDMIVNYIKGQKTHHLGQSFEEEMCALAGIPEIDISEFDE